jgi:hypothetical protein
VRTDSGVRGVVTAAHCPPEVDWYILNANASEQYDLNLYYEYWDNNEDWQYMKQDGSNPHPCGAAVLEWSQLRHGNERPAAIRLHHDRTDRLPLWSHYRPQLRRSAFPMV